MVEFDVLVDSKVRKVQRAVRLEQNVGTVLADSLSAPREPTKARVDVADSAEIIPFRVTPATRPMPPVQAARRRQG